MIYFFSKVETFQFLTFDLVGKNFLCNTIIVSRSSNKNLNLPIQIFCT